MKKIFWMVFIMLVSLTSVSAIKAEEGDTYEIFDGDELIVSFDNYAEADYFYRQNTSEYLNLVLRINGEAERMEYGTVSFEKGEQWYYSMSRRTSSFIDTSADALFLRADYDRVYFMIAGDIGYIGVDKVTYHPFDKTSCYFLKNGELHHALLNTQNDYYNYDLLLDAPEGTALKEGVHYYSYDGHYFYDDFYKLSDDMRADIRDNAINPDDPYYCYFLYLPYHSSSNYDSASFESFISDLFDGPLSEYVDNNGDGVADGLSCSMLYSNGATFAKIEQEQGVNALMLMGEGFSESALGKSLNSYIRNSLYSHLAYDSKEERENDCYDTVADSIGSFAEYYVNGRFANHRSSSFAGTFFGDKAAGITASFFADPYAGEKAASYTYRIDKKLGGQDLNGRALAFIKGSAVIYDEEGENVLYRLPRLTTYVLSVTGESEDSYTVIPDRLSAAGSVLKKDVLFVLNEDKIGKHEKDIEDFGDLIEEANTGEKNITISESPASFEEIRANSDPNVRCHLMTNISDLSVSGVRQVRANTHFFDTIYLKVKESVDQKNYAHYADFYGLNYVSEIKTDLYFNMIKIKDFDPLVVSVPLRSDDLNVVYSVYRKDKELGLVKVKTRRSSDHLQFIVEENGEYVVFAVDSLNNYDLEDHEELITLANCAPDSSAIVLEGLGLMILITTGTILIVIYQLIERRRERLWKDSRSLLAEPVSAHVAKLKS